MIVSLILGVIAWGGLWFRDPRIRALIPIDRTPKGILTG
jgi:hypothetical protein